MKENQLESCEGCVHLDISLFPNWWDGDCKAKGTINDIPIIERVHNARAEHGHCGPKRAYYLKRAA
jgi:hypothetical protein